MYLPFLRGGLNTCLLNTGYLLKLGNTKTGLTV